MYKLYCSSDNWKNLNKSRIFEEMYDGDYYTGECKIKFEFFGKLITINLQVMSEAEPTEYQRETLDKFMRIFPSIQEKIIKRIVEYYNKEQKNTYGPDDRDEMKKMWPDINSVDEMLKHLEFNSIIIQDEYLYNDGTVFLAFFYDYGDDTEGDGIGIKITDGGITEIGYISIAF